MAHKTSHKSASTSDFCLNYSFFKISGVDFSDLEKGGGFWLILQQKLAKGDISLKLNPQLHQSRAKSEAFDTG